MPYDPVADLHSLKVMYSRRAPGYGFPWACALPSQASRWNREDFNISILLYRATEASPIRRSATASTYQSKVLSKSFKRPRAFVSYHVFKWLTSLASTYFVNGRLRFTFFLISISTLWILVVFIFLEIENYWKVFSRPPVRVDLFKIYI